MAQTEEKVTIFSCDAAGCTRKNVADDGGAPAGFILGTVQISEQLGGGQTEWAAHAPVHIGKAVKTVLAKTGAQATEDTQDEGQYTES